MHDVNLEGQPEAMQLLRRLATGLDLSLEQLSLDASLADDLGLDSLDIVELTAALEENGVTVSERELWDLETVADVVALYLYNARKAVDR